MTPRPSGVNTLLAHGGRSDGDPTGAVAPPIHPSTTFTRDQSYELRGDFVYSRYANPTVALAEGLLRDLEGAAGALLFNSGLAAVAALFQTVRSGDRVVAPTVMYHGAQDWLRRLSEVGGVDLVLFDAARPGALAEATGEHAALVWIESPVNPTWDVVDIAEAASIAHGTGAVLAVDSSVAPPVTTRALALGADLVFHSATKYLNGHSDVLGGVLATSRCDPRWEEIVQVRKLSGGIMAPFEAWLLLRGMRTLGVRYERVSASALRFAEHFEGHSSIEAVLYPGLEGHPGHAVARRQMTGGFGGMLSMLTRGDGAATKAVASRLRTFTRATSFGGVESLVEHRATVEGPHSVVPKNLLRFSIGLEDVADLIDDLEVALRASG